MMKNWSRVMLGVYLVVFCTFLNCTFKKNHCTLKKIALFKKKIKSAMNKSAKYECTCRGIHMLFFIRYVTNKLGTHKLNIEEMFQDP